MILPAKDRFELPDLLAPRTVSSPPRRPPSLEDVERQHIVATLEKTGRRVSGDRRAAKILSLSERPSRSRMKKLGIFRRS